MKGLKGKGTILIGLGFALFVVMGMFLQSGFSSWEPKERAGVVLALLGGCAAFIATALGTIPALFIQRMSTRFEDISLGFAAGMMLAASAFSLILPALTAAGEIFASKTGGSLMVALGMGLGVLLMLGLDAVMPHEHADGQIYGAPSQNFPRVWLFVFAIILHNFPEGMAIGTAFSHADLSVGVPLTTAIALQDIPEGLAVVLALQAAGISIKRAVTVSILSGAVEPLGAAFGLVLANGFASAYPLGLALSAGAMIFVVSHEVIPQTHKNGHQTPATLGLMMGFMLMMVLDTALA